MKKFDLLHTPEGVRDIYNEECEKKHNLMNRLTNLIYSYGYHPIETPTFEFSELFGEQTGSVASNDLYRFFDRNGNTLALRPDFTPSVVRCAAKYYSGNAFPVKFCYWGKSFINYHSLQGRLNESTQMGVEYIGDGTVDADAEMLDLVVNNLKEAGLKDFQICVGYSGIFKNLISATGLNDDAAEELKKLIFNKNFFGAWDFVKERCADERLMKCFEMLGSIYKTREDLISLSNAATGFDELKKCFDYFIELKSLIEIYGISDYISFEPGVIGNYDYYTGIIFGAYTFGSGEQIVKGGRYNNLMSHFGSEKPAIGFVIEIDQLLYALERQNIALSGNERVNLIIYKASKRKEAIEMAKSLRSEGRFVSLMPYNESLSKEDHLEHAKVIKASEVFELTE